MALIDRLFRREKEPTRAELLMPDEQAVLEVFSQSVSANLPEVWSAMIDPRNTWLHQTLMLPSSAIEVVDSLEKKGLLEIDERRTNLHGCRYLMITEEGKAATRQVRKFDFRFVKPTQVAV